MGRRRGGQGGVCSRRGLVQRGCTPHFLFGLARKENGPCTVQKKRPLSALRCSGPPRATGVGVRECLRVCEDCPTGAAGYDAGLVVDSRGAVRLRSGCEDALDLLLFPRVPLRYALPWRA